MLASECALFAIASLVTGAMAGEPVLSAGAGYAQALCAAG
jgi:hypothetical protein